MAVIIVVGVCLGGCGASGRKSTRSHTNTARSKSGTMVLKPGSLAVEAAVKALNAAVMPSGTSSNSATDTCVLFPGNGAYHVAVSIWGSDSPKICAAVAGHSFRGIGWESAGTASGAGGKVSRTKTQCNLGSNVGDDGLRVVGLPFNEDNGDSLMNAETVCSALVNSGAWG